MKIFSLNISDVKTVAYKGKTITTGIFKKPVDKKLQIIKNQVEGDKQADLRVHGGEYKAVYAYAHEHYEYWTNLLGRDDLQPGMFGENLTTSGLKEESVYLGNIYKVGTALLKAVEPRFPCSKLAMKFDDTGVLKQFVRSRKWGIYFKVVKEGTVQKGDTITLESEHRAKIPLQEIGRLQLFDRDDIKGLNNLLQFDDLNPEYREYFGEQLSKIESKLKS